MVQALSGVALFQLGQIEPGAEMIALAVQHDGARGVGKFSQALGKRGHQRIAQGIALGWPAQTHDGHGAALLDLHFSKFGGRWMGKRHGRRR